jgi:aspartate/methionine/tyrosine aminotransferase
LDLTVSNPTDVGLFSDESWLTALAEPECAIYRPAPLGIESARRAVAEYFRQRGVLVEPEQIVLCASTSEAYSFLFKLLADPGDTILFPRPSYPLLEHLADLERVCLVNYAIRYDGAYYIDTDSVAQGISEACRAIVLISPNNPTGSCTSRSEYAALAELGMPIISDEVFADYPLESESGAIGTVLSDATNLVFALGGLSKLAGLPQLKLAWIVVGGPERLRREALERLELICDTFLSVNTPVQVALPRLLDMSGQRQEPILQRLRSNYATLRQRLSNTPVTLRTAQGGWSAVLQLPRLTSTDWALRLLTEARVLVQPGWFYDDPHEGIVVTSLLTPEKDLAEGLERLLKNLER